MQQKLTKNRKKAEDKLEKGKLYSLKDAAGLVKEVTTANFDASVDLHVRLAVDPRKADQAIRGTVSLPHGTGKTKRVLVFCEPDQEQEALDAGADYAGLDEYVSKIEGGWMDVDVVIATPGVMPKIAKLGRVLGPRNLMPNPKVGTVTDKLSETVQDVKKGKVSFRVDKFGIIHSTIGKISFSPDQLAENGKALIDTLVKMKPASAKGNYLKSIFMASSMSPGIQIDPKTV